MRRAGGLDLAGRSQSSTPRRFCFPRVPSAGTKDGEPESGRAIFEPDLPGRKPKLRLTQRPRPEVLARALTYLTHKILWAQCLSLIVVFFGRSGCLIGSLGGILGNSLRG